MSLQLHSKSWLFLAVTVFVSCAGPLSTGFDERHQACVRGDLDACEARGRERLANDRRGALTAFRFACLEGRSRACTDYAKTHAGSKESQGLTAESKTLLKNGCIAGDTEACYQFAERVGGARIEALYEAACAKGHQRACVRWARYLRSQSNDPMTNRRALRLDEAACGEGIIDGCLGAGHAYLFGAGVVRSAERGIQFLDATCTSETAVGCAVLIKMYEKGLGVPIDLKVAEQYRRIESLHAPSIVGAMTVDPYLVYLDACNHGDPLGCYASAFAIAEGIDRPRNISMARELFDRACGDGLQAACGRWTTIEPRSLQR
jgi:hypothetical protein